MGIIKIIVAVLVIGVLLAGAFYVLKPPMGKVDLHSQEQRDYLVQVKVSCTIQDKTGQEFS